MLQNEYDITIKQKLLFKRLTIFVTKILAGIHKLAKLSCIKPFPQVILDYKLFFQNFSMRNVQNFVWPIFRHF